MYGSDTVGCDRVTSCRASDIQTDFRVCYYDELPEATKEQFPVLLDSERDARTILWGTGSTTVTT